MSEETEEYLSDSDEFPAEDIILHGSDNSTVNTIEIYEDSILEEEDSVFEVSAIVDKDKSTVAGDSPKIGSDDVKKVATDNDGNIVNEDKVEVAIEENEGDVDVCINKSVDLNEVVVSGVDKPVVTTLLILHWSQQMKLS